MDQERAQLVTVVQILSAYSAVGSSVVPRIDLFEGATYQYTR